jgi:hypothetical protein
VELTTGPQAHFSGAVDLPGEESFTFSTEATGGDALKRVLSCMIVASLTSEGIEEAFESLRDMLDFYSLRRASVRVEPARLLEGTVVSASERPRLVIPED